MKIALLGYGRMGKAIEEIALERGHEIVIRKDVDPIDVDLSLADAAIDFSHPAAAFDNIKDCIDSNVAVVSGTTGWLDRFDEIKSYCEAHDGAFIYASNFSIGVNLFFNLNAHLAKMMEQIKGYDVAMEEIHHVHKLDAPSGTAISLANDILENSEKKQWNIETADSDDLFIKVKREGEVPGTHSVSYTSAIDAIEIKHTAFNRTGFALGAVVAAEWLHGKKGVFNMKDVLSL
ncbi:4-hydroxy-tetrahydrodipicolinate reductase [Lutimonas halocynthiae]|uniref:4-hydroxy-tetrahydrodipicolinate reductase n=1 Tax=Lutimonas halocynthiae TaxID=1446477 RepID=UPI0025B5E35A|nr:4-hydroxy-tetrahydrodipicolinate reductase [Lutimonas halocynthiae]MDN3643721.1 4-hydroxy-tetrahydrodipicolinate reductase [Lutimonas halocynthiae]